jgi:hypothetical protein
MDKECLDILDCYSIGNVVYFEGTQDECCFSRSSSNRVIDLIRKSGKLVEVY